MTDVPLSRDPNDIKADMNWSGHILTIGIALTIAARLALKFVTSFGVALVVGAVLVLLEWNAGREAEEKT